MRKRSIELGQALVDELGLGEGVDTLSRWMAHYVAEQMAVAEQASGEEKEAAEERCFETILKLWGRRASLPRGKRPFERFEMVFRALESLAPENRPRSTVPVWLLQEKEGDLESQPEVKEWLDVAHAIDDSAKVLIRYCLGQAYAAAATDEVKEWLRKSTDIGLGEDVTVIARLASFAEEFDAQGERQAGNEAVRNELISVLATLEKFEDGVRAMIDELEQ